MSIGRDWAITRDLSTFSLSLDLPSRGRPTPAKPARRVGPDRLCSRISRRRCAPVRLDGRRQHDADSHKIDYYDQSNQSAQHVASLRRNPDSTCSSARTATARMSAPSTASYFPTIIGRPSGTRPGRQPPPRPRLRNPPCRIRNSRRAPAFHSLASRESVGQARGDEQAARCSAPSLAAYRFSLRRAAMAQDRPPTTDEIRRAIDNGETNDKVNFPDSAAAPSRRTARRRAGRGRPPASSRSGRLPP